MKTLTEIIPSLPAASHDGSTLMTIAPEIRVKILRELLVANSGSIDERKSYFTSGSETIENQNDKRRHKSSKSRKAVKRKQSARKEVEGYGITPSILRCCQLLLREGLVVLYGENTLVLDINIMYSLQLTSAALEAVLYDTEEMPFFSPFSGTTFLTNPAASKAATAIARRFSHFITKINADHLFDTGFRSCSLQFEALMDYLQSLVVDSCLQVDVISRRAPNLAATEVAEDMKYLRCKKFTLTGVDPVHAEAVARLVTGSVDLRTPLNEVLDQRDILWAVSKNLSNIHKQMMDEKLNQLYKAAREADATLFAQMRSEIFILLQYGLVKLHKTWGNMLDDDEFLNKS